MSLAEEVANQAELLRGTGQVVGFRWEQGDTLDQRRQLINLQAQTADVLRERGWHVLVAIERPTPTTEVYAVKIDQVDAATLQHEDQLE